MIHKILIQSSRGPLLASREAYMMNHPGVNDEDLQPGDIIELVEGFFVLNADLNPTQLATDEQMRQAKYN